MAAHDDLLRRAEQLLLHAKTGPRQTNLRGAVSSAYYAVFHLLGYEASRLVTTDRLLRPAVARTLKHNEMKEVSHQFRAQQLPAKYHAVTQTLRVPTELRQVAGYFLTLQEARHHADYRLHVPLTRLEAEGHVQDSHNAFERWASVRGDEMTKVFLVSLLLHSRLKQALS